MIKLSGYAKKHGITYRTAYTHFRKTLLKGPIRVLHTLDFGSSPNASKNQAGMT